MPLNTILLFTTLKREGNCVSPPTTTQPMPVQNEQADLLSRIRRFFGLRAKA